MRSIFNETVITALVTFLTTSSVLLTIVFKEKIKGLINNKWNKRNGKKMEDIIQLREDVTELKDKISTPDFLDSIMENELKNNKLVNSLLTSLKKDFEADRVYIFTRHNGGNSITGKSFQRMTCTHEVLSDGVSSRQEDSQNILMSSMNYYIEKVVNDNMQYQDTEDIEDYILKSMCRRYNCQSIIGVPLIDENGTLVAIFGMDWVFEKAPQFCTSASNDEDYGNFKEQLKELIKYL